MEFVSCLHRFYRESISYVEEKNNPAKNMMATCSISWFFRRLDDAV
jgi:hypothetical protein